jgi:hypothetical protein
MQKTLITYSYFELERNIQREVIDSYRAYLTPARIKRDTTNEFLTEFLDYLEPLGFKVVQDTIDIDLYDGCSYIAQIDIKKLLHCPMSYLTDMLPDVQHDFTAWEFLKLIKEEINSDKLYVQLMHYAGKSEITLSSMVTTQKLNEKHTENMQLLHRTIRDAVLCCFNPINRHIQAVIWERFIQSRTTLAIEKHFSSADIRFLKSGYRITEEDI